MPYIDGFVIAVPRARKQDFIEHAKTGGGAFMDLGAKRILECWEDDVPEGKVTDFRRAVQAFTTHSRPVILSPCTSVPPS